MVDACPPTCGEPTAGRFCRNKVADFEKWKAVFDSHTQAHREAGLILQHLWQNIDDPNDVFFLFEVEDISKAKAFITSPAAPDAKEKSGIIGEPEIYFLK